MLDLGNNALDHLPSEIGQLHSLRQLRLSLVGDAALDEALSQLTRLEVLDLAHNNIDRLPSWIGRLHRLRYLDLTGNPPLSLPPELGGLRRLTNLYLGGHAFAEVPEVLRTLEELVVLDLSKDAGYGVASDPGTPSRPEGKPRPAGSMYASERTARGGWIRELPTWFTSSFPRLERLSVGGQRLRALPPTLPNGLTAVCLAGNTFAGFPPALLSLPALREVDLRGNQLSDLPGDLASLRGRLTYLGLAGNWLSIPPEILDESDDPDAILDYLSRTTRGPTRPLDEAKVLVVGEASVGKTSLIKRLVSQGFSEIEEKTEGIDVTEWGVEIKGDRIRLNVWDFGGQEIMHSTHQFFLTKRSLYLLVIDNRQDEDQNRIEYWLKLIRSFSGSSPVVIVGNKYDQAPLDIDGRGLRNKYRNIIGICEVSCKTNYGIDEIQGLLVDSIERLPHVRDLLPETYFDIKGELENFDANFLPFEKYIELCMEHGLTAESEQELLVGFLHDLGTVVCFRDDPRLKDTHILNPRWVTGGVYRILNAWLAAQRKGLLGWPDIERILATDDYPAERRVFIVDMMKKFELCYESESIFLIPDLLTREEPDTGAWDEALRFEVAYEVLPSSIISRLIVRMRAHISMGTVWRTGAVFSMDSNRALVQGDREDRRIKIAVDGPPNGRRGLLTAIRSELRSIHQTIPRLHVEERVPVPGHPDIWVPYRHLLDLEAAGRQAVTPHDVTPPEDFDIRELLAGVEAPGDRDQSRGPKPAGPTPSPNGQQAGRDQREGAPPEQQAWRWDHALKFGLLLLLAFVAAAAAFAVVDHFLGTPTATAATSVALMATIVVGLSVLRASDRISERASLGP